MLKFLWKKAVNHEWEGLMQEKLDAIDGDIIGNFNQEVDLYSSYIQLDEFKTLMFTLVGSFSCKTFKGAEIHLIGSNDQLVVQSDMQEIDTDYSKKTNVGITEFDMELDDDSIQFLTNNPLEKIEFIFENSGIAFSITEGQKLIDSLSLIDHEAFD